MYIYIYIFIYIFEHICLSVCLSVCLPVCLSVCLSVYAKRVETRAFLEHRRSLLGETTAGCRASSEGRQTSSRIQTRSGGRSVAEDIRPGARERRSDLSVLVRAPKHTVYHFSAFTSHTILRRTSLGPARSRRLPARLVVPKLTIGICNVDDDNIDIGVGRIILMRAAPFQPTRCRFAFRASVLPWIFCPVKCN
jgi:hypothetical protein